MVENKDNNISSSQEDDGFIFFGKEDKPEESKLSKQKNRTQNPLRDNKLKEEDDGFIFFGEQSTKTPEPPKVASSKSNKNVSPKKEVPVEKTSQEYPLSSASEKEGGILGWIKRFLGG